MKAKDKKLVREAIDSRINFRMYRHNKYSTAHSLEGAGLLIGLLVFTSLFFSFIIYTEQVVNPLRDKIDELQDQDKNFSRVHRQLWAYEIWGFEPECIEWSNITTWFGGGNKYHGGGRLESECPGQIVREDLNTSDGTFNIWCVEEFCSKRALVRNYEKYPK